MRQAHLPASLAIANHHKQDVETLGLATARFQGPITGFVSIER